MKGQARTLDCAAFETVVAEAAKRDLPVSFDSGTDERPLKYLYIAGRPCQVSRTKLAQTSPDYPHSEALSIYLPRTSFADFVICVPMDIQLPDLYIIPRGKLEKDTWRTRESLEEYKNAWHLLGEASLDMMMRRNNRLSWQLQSAILSADSRGLQFELIPTVRGKKRPNDFRTFNQRRIMIEGKRCAIYSASEVPQRLRVRILVLKGGDDWADFHLYLTKAGVTYVVPRGHIPKTTTLSVNSPTLVPYASAWHLLSAQVSEK
jgi:hypothetical protein